MDPIRHIFLTGEKQVGKSTLWAKTLERSGIRPTGFQTLEYLVNGCFRGYRLHCLGPVPEQFGNDVPISVATNVRMSNKLVIADYTTKALCDDIAADTSAVAGKAYLGEVTCSDLPASMNNAEIVVEIMAGTTAQNKVIVLTCTSGNAAPYMWKYTYWNNGTDVSGWKGFQEQLVSGTNIKTINSNSILGSGNLDIDGLPSQTGNNGKVLMTNGTTASWETPTTITMRTWGANE